MAFSKLQTAGGPDLGAVAESGPASALARGNALLYSGIVLGLVAGAAVSTYLWRQRVRALNLLNLSPLERAEALISSCESKLEDIERAFEDMKAN
jgi:hypothetical protein